MLQEHFRIRERQTLMVLAQAIGPWGFATSMARVAQQLFGPGGVRGTLVTPGLDQTELFRFVEALGPHYDQTLLVSYPAVLPGLLEAGIERGIDWPALRVGFFTSGEGIAETQRERILRYAGRDPERLDGWVAGFGASEVTGLVGYETHLCLLLRRLCTHTPALAEALFGSPVLPSLVQYNPLSHYLQAREDQVLLTNRGAAPLVRYNTHDRGGLLTLAEVEAGCRAHGYDLRAELAARGFGPASVRPLPFLYVFGRSNAVIVHGGKIYLDQAAHVLGQPALQALEYGKLRAGRGHRRGRPGDPPRDGRAWRGDRTDGGLASRLPGSLRGGTPAGQQHLPRALRRQRRTDRGGGGPGPVWRDRGPGTEAPAANDGRRAPGRGPGTARAPGPRAVIAPGAAYGVAVAGASRVCTA